MAEQRQQHRRPGADTDDPGHPRVALVTCHKVADLHTDDRSLVAALAARGVEAVPAVWDDPTVDWLLVDLAVIRSTWDYTTRRDAFVAWARSVPNLRNRADLIEWNSDKRYLAELAAAGLPVVPTRYLPVGAPADLPTEGRYVVKPSVGAGSVDTARFDPPAENDQAIDLVERIHRSGRTAIIQPYLDAVDDRGETALIQIGGCHSHAIRKDVLLTGPVINDGLCREEIITARKPTDAELDLVGQVTDFLTARFALTEPLLYLRVDLLPDSDGSPVVLEVELIEPSLFLDTAEGALELLADAIAGATVTAAATASAGNEASP
jgi:hypothetical protein